MKITFAFSDAMFRKYLSHKAASSRIAFFVSIVLFLLLTFLNRRVIGLPRLGMPWLTNIVVWAVIFAFLFGIAGFIISIGLRGKTYNCQLEVEGNTVTYMCVSNTPLLIGSGGIGMQGWHMEKVMRVEERSDCYIIYGTGVHVSDTRIMPDQKKVNRLKVPKWFSGMEALKAVPDNI